ncbi:MAG: hypothetical protein MJZ78_06370 [Bacteroidales bacterium]|nr:hypothetical protein [Bacteroidales bacterium]
MKRFSMAMMGLALAGLMTMVSCRKPVIGFSGDGRVVTISAVTESGNGSKTAIDGQNVNWSVGDQIRMNAESVLTLKEGAGTTEGVFEGPVTGDGPYRIGYPADATTYSGTTLKLSILAEWTYDTEKQIVPMVAVTNSVEGGLQFHNAVNMLKMQLKGGNTEASKLKSIVFTSATSNLSGDISVTFDGEGNPTFNAIAGDGASKTMTVLFGDGLQLTAEAAQCVYIPLAKINGGDLTVRFDCANGIYVEKKLTATSAFDAVNNMLDCGEVEVKAVPVFSVSATTTVFFSPGNLQYLGQAEEGHKWRFAEHQWDYMGDGPNTTTGNKGNVDLTSLGYLAGMYNTGSGTAGPSETDADKAAARDLFGWGCTGYQDTRTSSETEYQPYSTANRNKYYGPYGKTYELSVEYKSDWGCNTIYCGDIETEAGWYTLSKAEWTYLFNTRTTNTTGLPNLSRYAMVKVNGVKGLLIFPDIFAWDETKMGTAPDKVNCYVDYPISYTVSEFTEQEKAGVIFLPAVGYRYYSSGNKFSQVGVSVCYWSRSVFYQDSDSYSSKLAFSSAEFNCDKKAGRYNGNSVRLVRNVK